MHDGSWHGRSWHLLALCSELRAVLCCYADLGKAGCGLATLPSFKHAPSVTPHQPTPVLAVCLLLASPCWHRTRRQLPPWSPAG